MADREPSTRGSAALKIRRSWVQIRDLLASSTAAKYSSRAALQRSVWTPNAALTCSTSVGDDPARGSGRRVRRFKSCHPDQCSRIRGRRPKSGGSHQAPDITGPSLLTETPGPRKAVLRREGRTRCPPERARTAARRHLERPSSPPHNPVCSSESERFVLRTVRIQSDDEHHPAVRDARSAADGSLRLETTQQYR